MRDCFASRTHVGKLLGAVFSGTFAAYDFRKIGGTFLFTVVVMTSPQAQRNEYGVSG